MGFATAGSVREWDLHERPLLDSQTTTMMVKTLSACQLLSGEK